MRDSRVVNETKASDAMTTQPVPLSDAEVAAFRELAKETKRQWYDGSFVDVVTDESFSNFLIVADRLAAEWQELRRRESVLLDRVDYGDETNRAHKIFRDKLESDLAAAKERIAEYESHYARERYTNELADYRTMETNWLEREAALRQQLAERDAEIERLSRYDPVKRYVIIDEGD